jgi:hypothetical protein
MGELSLMALDGRITVDVLFQDTDGTTSLKVVSLEDTTQYGAGKVAFVTGTAGTAAVTVANSFSLPYRNAAGDLVTFSTVKRVAFAWQGTQGILRGLDETGDSAFSIASTAGEIAVTGVELPGVVLQLPQSQESGTYAIVIYGT